MAALGATVAQAATAAGDEPGPEVARALVAAGATKEEIVDAIKASGVQDDIEAEMVAAAAIALNEGKPIDEVMAAVVAAGGTDVEARAAAQEAIDVAARAAAATAGTAAAATAGTAAAATGAAAAATGAGATATRAVTRTATRAVANVVFALTPASSVQGIIDFNTKIGAQIYACLLYTSPSPRD